MNQLIRHSDEEVARVRFLLRRGATANEVANEMHLSRAYVCMIRDNLIRRGIGEDASHSVSVWHKRALQRERLIVVLAENGYGFGEIAAAGDLARSHVYRILKRHNLLGARKSWKTTPATRREIVRMSDDGWTHQVIANRFGLTQPAVGYIIRQHHKRMRSL